MHFVIQHISGTLRSYCISLQTNDLHAGDSTAKWTPPDVPIKCELIQRGLKQKNNLGSSKNVNKWDRLKSYGFSLLASDRATHLLKTYLT